MNLSESSRRSWWLRATGISALAFSMLLGASPTSATTAVDLSTSQTETETATSVPDLVEEVYPSVVTVYAIAEDQRGLSVGTGFVYDDEGNIVTNWHVVFDAAFFIVGLSDGTQLEAELVGQDPYDDVAVVRLKDPDQSPDPLPIGDEGDLRLGDPVVAIGTPGGFLPGSVSSGIVSGLDRDQLANTENPCQVYANMIQHDAAISQGNSGGPLFNMDGEVVGINTVGLPVNEGGVPNQNLNFAVPGSRVKKVADDMIANGVPSIAIMGIQTEGALPDSSRFQFENIFQIGAEVTDVQPEGPADEAGLREGDIITKINDKIFTVESGMTSQIAALSPGDEIEITYWRGNRERTTMLTLGEASEASLNRCTLEQEDSGN